MSIRLSLMIESGAFSVPETGRIAVFHPQQADDLSDLPTDRVTVIQPQKPLHDFWAERGYDTCPALDDGARFVASVVFLPRAKPLARQLVAEAAAVTDGPVLIDGAKTDGIDSMLTALKKRTVPSAAVSKAHGKVFWVDGGIYLSDWRTDAAQEGDGYVTAPGVFSADGVDPASRLLVQALPQKLGKRVADLGAGWGYLSTEILQRDGVTALHLVEADHASLGCARQNVQDERAEFHWADARIWGAKGSLDTVVMNPPFHSGRTVQPSLGQAFIANAARLLVSSGQLWMVANRHLPYEAALAEAFVSVAEISGDNRFKILHAAKPRRSR